MNASEVTKEKALYVYAIEHDIPFDIGRVINEDILERMERVANTTLGFPSLIIKLCQHSQVPIEENEEKTPWNMPISPKGLKTKLRKLVRRQTPRDMSGYDLGMEASDEEGDEVNAEEKEEEEVAAEAEDDDSDEMPPLGHQSKLVIQNVSDMLYDHHQAVYERMDKQNEWHKNMYEKPATTSSILAYRQDVLWESVDSLARYTRDLLAHPFMQERHKGIVPLSVVREMPP